MIRQRRSKTAVACATLGAAIVCALAFSIGPAAAAPKPKPECSDHIDNDGDGVVDYRKRGGDDDCTSREDTSERLTLECSDLDGDGYAWDPPTLPHATASCIPGPGGTGMAYITPATATTTTSTVTRSTAASTGRSPSGGRRSATASMMTPTGRPTRGSRSRRQGQTRRSPAITEPLSRSAIPALSTPTATRSTVAKPRTKQPDSGYSRALAPGPCRRAPEEAGAAADPVIKVHPRSRQGRVPAVAGW